MAIRVILESNRRVLNLKRNDFGVCLTMNGATFGPEARITLPCGETLNGSEMTELMAMINEE